MSEVIDHRSELLSMFRMEPADLDANRAGVLAASQAIRLQKSGLWNLVMSLFIGGALCAIVVLVAEKPLQPVQVILAAGLAVAALATGLVTFQRARAAADTAQVECLTGPIRVRMRGRAGWYVYVGERQFRLPGQFWHFQNGASYRVFVAPKANRIVAMEPDGWA